MIEHRDEDRPRAVKGRGGPWLAITIKASVTAVLVWWLLHSGALEFSRVGILVGSKRVFLITAATWLTMTAGLTTLRWWILLRGVGQRIPLRRALALQTMALFFNGVVPGNIGGDLLKNHALVGRQSGRLVVLVLVERSIGVIALVWVAGIGLIPSLGQFSGHSRLPALLYLILVLIGGSIVGPWILFWARLDDKVRRLLTEPSAVGLLGKMRGTILRGLNSLFVSLEWVRGAKSEVALAFLVSLVMHFGNMLYFLFLTRELGNPSASMVDVALVFPVGMLSLVLPVSISGLGVGHVMFNGLFSIVGMTGGANVFNVYIVAQLAPCLMGAVPYLLRTKDRPEQALGSQFIDEP